MKVLTEQCATCIFRPGNLMHLHPQRVKQMVVACKAVDGYIPCHETMQYEDEDSDEYRATMDSPVCRGFYDAYPGLGQIIRIAERLGMIEFVDPPKGE
jgi:hypothetical protein